MSRGYEERYLLTLLSAVVNQKTPIAPIGSLDWGKFFRLADYHRVAHVIHYGLMGMDTLIPQQMRQRFFDKYLESVFRSSRLKAGEEKLIAQLEERGIRCVILNDFRLVSCYPVEEMSCRDCIEILVGEKSMDAVKRLMKQMDFEEESASGVRGRIYYSIPGIRVKFYETVPYFFSKVVKRHYKHFIEAMPFRNGCDYVHEMTLEEMYLYLLCRITESYALGDISLCQLEDLWLFYQKYVDNLAWDYIDERIERLKIVEFEERLEQLMMRWAGAETPLAELEIYDSMEAYILTKGEEGRSISSKFLPLIKTVADCYARNRRKENLRKKLQWLFPEREYMEAIYPVLEKAGILLPVCWILRLLRYGFRTVRTSVSNAFSSLLGPLSGKLGLGKKQTDSSGEEAPDENPEQAPNPGEAPEEVPGKGIKGRRRKRLVIKEERSNKGLMAKAAETTDLRDDHAGEVTGVETAGLETEEKIIVLDNSELEDKEKDSEIP